VRHDKLKQIEQDCGRETERCKTEMLNRWLQRDPEASWSKVVEAVQRMDRVVLAQQLQGKYIHLPSRGETGLIPCISLTNYTSSERTQEGDDGKTSDWGKPHTVHCHHFWHSLA